MSTMIRRILIPRRFFAALLFGLLLGAVGSAGAEEGGNTDLARFLPNDGNSVYSARGLLRQWPAEGPKAGGAPTAATEDGKPGAPPKGRAADRRPPDDSGAPAQGQSAKRAERPVSETEETKNA